MTSTSTPFRNIVVPNEPSHYYTCADLTRRAHCYACPLCVHILTLMSIFTIYKEISLSFTHLPVPLNRFFSNIPLSNSYEQTPLHTETLPHAQLHASSNPSQSARCRMYTYHTTLFILCSDISSRIATYNIHYSPLLFSLLEDFIPSTLFFSPLFTC